MYEHLPGGEILDRGLKSLRQGVVDEDSLLLLIAAHRLGRCGTHIAELDTGAGFPENRLYDFLNQKYGSEAYRLYRSLTKQLTSLENAMENLTGQ